MSADRDSLDSKLAKLLSTENINRQVLASLLRKDTHEQLAGSLFITNTLLNESLELLEQLAKELKEGDKSFRILNYFIEYTESHRQRGKKILDSAKKGHEAVYGTEDEKQERRNEILKACKAVARKNPNWKLTAIRQQVAEDMKLSSRTIQRSIPDLKELLGR